MYPAACWSSHYSFAPLPSSQPLQLIPPSSSCLNIFSRSKQHSLNIVFLLNKLPGKVSGEVSAMAEDQNSRTKKNVNLTKTKERKILRGYENYVDDKKESISVIFVVVVLSSLLCVL